MQGIKETQENTVLIPGLERSPGAGNGNQLQNSCLGNPMDRGVWWVTIHGVTESDTTELLSTHAYIYLFACAGCSCGMWDLQCLLWHVRLFFLSCSMWDLVLGPPALGVRSLTHWTIREALDACISDVKPSILILTLTVSVLQEVVHCTCSHVYLVPGTHEHHCSQSRRETDEQERTRPPV